MKRFWVGFCFVLVASGQLVGVIKSPTVAAAPSTGLVISHVISGESSSSSSEFVAIYNNSSSDIEMTGYCLKNKAGTSFTCVASEANTKVYVRSHNYLTFASAVFSSTHGYVADSNYSVSNAIQVGGDSLSLIDTAGNEIDKVTWGTSGGGISAATNGTLQRKADAINTGMLVDTDTMAADFTALTSLVYPPNASYDVVTLVDVCPNIPGVQQTMPTNYLADENGNCQPDSCLNIAGLQVSIPDHFDSDTQGNCTQHDECSNVEGIQITIPDNMLRGEANECVWDIVPLQLTEILPNAAGSDTGNEFIEIHNPTNRIVDLSLYTIKTGVNSDKAYSFPDGATIAPGEYRAFSDSLMKFTLVNTSGRVVLAAIDGSVLGDTGVYTSPADGESWAAITGAWQYTNQPTPGGENTASVIDEKAGDTTDTALAPCPAGKYRSPLTNRCRSIATDAVVLASCDVDQYRNPDTGRCKKIDTSSLAPCKDGQYRSEETNRCRNIVTASTQKPCNDNQYRSEETNRCRNLPASSVPDAAFAVQPVKDTGMAFVGWWALGGVGLLAAGYGVWEWRREISGQFGKLFSLFSKTK